MKKAVILFALFLLLGGFVRAEEIGRLDYGQKDWLVAEGDISLSFNWSDRDNVNDLIILKILYEPTYNLSIFRVESKIITYDYSFINDTKYYHFNNTIGNDTKDYVIKVDYSSIVVPASPINQLRQLVAEQNETIFILVSQLENLSSNYSTLYNETTNLSSEYQIQSDYIEFLETYKRDTDDYVEIKREKENLTYVNINLKSTIQDLQKDVRDRDKTIGDLENPLGIFYTKGEIGLTQVNIPWILIGAVLGLVAYFLFRSRQYHKAILKSPLSRMFGKEEKKPEPQVWVDEEKPDIEKKFLKPIPKEDIAQEVDKVIKQSMERQIDPILYG
jgi:gas vesicle protein